MRPSVCQFQTSHAPHRRPYNRLERASSDKNVDKQIIGELELIRTSPTIEIDTIQIVLMDGGMCRADNEGARPKQR